MAYIDLFMAAVPDAGKGAYEEFLGTTHAVIREFGALEVHDFWGDDVPDGKVTSMPMAVKCEPGETVVAGWIVWPSKEMRETGMQKMMSDLRMANMPMPFDGKRMIFGGFVPLLQTT